MISLVGIYDIFVLLSSCLFRFLSCSSCTWLFLQGALLVLVIWIGSISNPWLDVVTVVFWFDKILTSSKKKRGVYLATNNFI